MCVLILWLWICFVGGIGALVEGNLGVGVPAVSAGLITLVYLSTPSEGGRWLIRAALVVVWFGGGVLLWHWTVKDWTVALRIAFGVLGGSALIAYLIYGPATRRRGDRHRAGPCQRPTVET